MAPAVTVIGAGLAGSEAAWQLAQRGAAVTLVEMRPSQRSAAHESDAFAELVCSNSLRSDRLENAVGLLKEEMRRLHSLIMEAADATRVPAGGALAVDRTRFAAYVTGKIENHPRIRVERREAGAIPEGPCIVATGPLSSEAITAAIEEKLGEASLHFYDAAAPIVLAESLDMSKVFRQSRYGRGDDYLNCPMTQDEYNAFYDALISAETAQLHGFEEKRVFEGCMPVEVMARRGRQTLCFGPMKPVGLCDPRTGKMPFAVVQLRQDDAAGRMVNLVGFQTHLKFPEQRRVFRMIPGLEQAEFARYGVMHRNTYMNAPRFLEATYRLRGAPQRLYFAGQMTGVEGYVESASSGLAAALALWREMAGFPTLPLPPLTAIGALAHYVASSPTADFQPMNVNFGLMAPLGQKVRGKAERYRMVSERALSALEAYIQATEVQ